MQRELTELVNRLRGIRVSDSHADYTYLVSAADKYNDKPRIFSLLESNRDSASAILPLVLTFVSKLDPVGDERTLMRVIDFIGGMRRTSSEENDWIIKILFMMLEKVREQRRDTEVKLRLYEYIKTYSEKASIVNHLMSLMCQRGTGEMVAEILGFIPSASDELIRTAMQQSNLVILKNLSHILAQLSMFQRHLFVNFQHFDDFLDSEHFFLRNCYLEILENLAPHFKDENMVAELDATASIVVERLSDVYFLVRYRALQVLGTLFRDSCVTLAKRAEAITEVCGRILDKTVIVRKKAITLCSTLLMDHPFLEEKSLEKKSGVKAGPGRERYYEDMHAFHDLMKRAQENVCVLLNSEAKSELVDCIEFIKLVFYYKIEGSREAFELLFDSVWNEDVVEPLLASFNDLLVRMRSHKEFIEFMKLFIRREGNPSLEKILRELSARRYIDKRFVSSLCDAFLENRDLYEISYSLAHIGRPLSSEIYYEMLKISTNVLFCSRNKEELADALAAYKNVLRIRVREKLDTGNEVLVLIIKNLVKMTFFDHQIVDITIDAIYALGKLPERMVVELLDKLCAKNTNSLKIIHGVGYAGLRHYLYLDELQRAVKSNKATVTVDRSTIPPDIRERRISINASRQSIGSRVQEEAENMPDEDRSFCVGTSQDAKQEMASKLVDKTEDEISDLFFYITEHEMLYGEDGFLMPFVRLVKEQCRSEDPNMQAVAYASFCRLMCVSSEFFLENYGLFMESLGHPSPRIRANGVVAMSDFMLSYNTIVEGDTHVLFDLLHDEEPQVKKNALLVIYNLLLRNMLKLKGNSASLAFLLLDPDEEMREMVKKLLRQIASRENIISTVFYEAVTSRNEGVPAVIDFLTGLVDEKIKEAIFMKALRSRIDADVLRHMFEAFGLSDRFVEDLGHLDEFRRIRGIVQPQEEVFN
jgi:condensin complex subunit 1